MTRISIPFPVLLPPGGQRILVIQAHPDDAEHLCGGTIALLADEGKDISYLFVTRGDSCHARQTDHQDIQTWVLERAHSAGVEHKFKYAEAFHHYVMGG